MGQNLRPSIGYIVSLSLSTALNLFLLLSENPPGNVPGNGFRVDLQGVFQVVFQVSPAGRGCSLKVFKSGEHPGVQD